MADMLELLETAFGPVAFEVAVAMLVILSFIVLVNGIRRVVR